MTTTTILTGRSNERTTTPFLRDSSRDSLLSFISPCSFHDLTERPPPFPLSIDDPKCDLPSSPLTRPFFFYSITLSLATVHSAFCSHTTLFIFLIRIPSRYSFCLSPSHPPHYQAWVFKKRSHQLFFSRHISGHSPLSDGYEGSKLCFRIESIARQSRKVQFQRTLGRKRS